FSEKVFPVIAEKRKLKLTPEALIQKGPYTPSEALTNGLVDRVIYRDDLFAALGQEGAVFQDVSALFQNDDRRWFGTWDESVAIISIDGTISEGESFRSPLNGETVTGSDTVIRAVDAALHNPATRAIILRVNSGGGAVTASDYIWKKLAQVATDPVHPMLVIATFGDMAASGGYYVAAQSSRIFVSPMTLTGSIGVIFSKPNLEGLLAKFKVRTDGVRIGTNAGIDSMFRGFSPEQREKVTGQIMESYREFLKIVREGRAGKKEISKEKMEDIGQGRVWTGQDALSNGLADEEGGIGNALEYIEDTLRLNEDRVSFVYYNPVAEGFGGLTSLLGGLGFNAGRPGTSVVPFNALDFAGSLLGIRKRNSGAVSRRLVQKKSPFTLPLWALEKEWLTRAGLQYRIPDEKLKQVK
ncbi:MAG: S49 family peptidase, partial [Spirochaetia bacterium]|nr:S49 family peptidase [Spirochaetia bacterium]